MKKIYLLICTTILLNNLSFSQWNTAGGPSGGFTREIVATENALIVSAGNGGIYKSTNNGETWELQVSGLPLNEGVQDLIASNGSLYASLSRNGIYLSTDEAQNWIPINNGISSLTFYNFMVLDSEIYAGNANGGIYYSDNKGATWTEKSDGISDIQFQDFAYFNSAVYAGGRSLFKSLNNGDTWEEIEVVGLGANGVRSMTSTENSLFLADDGNIFVSSDGMSWNKCTLSIGSTITTMGVSGDSVYLTASSGRFYYTKDEGLNWTLVQNNETSNFANDIIFLDDRIIMSTSEGLYSSYDGGNVWEESNQGINALQIESIAKNDEYLFAGTERQGIYRRDFEGNWVKINNGLNALNATSIHDIIVLEDNVVLGTGGGVYILADTGDEWIRMFDPGINKSIHTLDFDNGIFAAAVNGSGIYISLDTTKTFTLTETNDLNTQTSYESILVEGDTIVVSTHNGEIFLSENLGQSWTDISITGDYYFTYDLHFADEKLYAATAKGLLYSENLGMSWNFFNNVTKTITSVTVIDNKVYASASDGVYVTSDSREIWYDVSGELGNQWTNEIVLIGDKIYAGTFASSVWELPILEANLPPIILSAQAVISDEDTTFSIPLEKLTVDDDNTYPGDFSISVQSGDNYSVDTNIITPIENFSGMLTVPVLVNDGLDDSPIFDLSIEISPVNDPPIIVEYTGTTTIARNESLEILLSDFTVTDIDNEFPTDFSLSVHEGENYQVTGNRISPTADYVGTIDVPIKVNDGELDSQEFSISFQITEILGLDNEFIKDKFSIYPNPTSDFLTVIPSEQYEYQLSIYTVQGELVHISNIGGNSNRQINLKELEQGLYLLQITNGDRYGVMKLIVKKN